MVLEFNPPAQWQAWRYPLAAVVVYLVAVFASPFDRVVLAVVVIGAFIIFALWRIVIALERQHG